MIKPRAFQAVAVALVAGVLIGAAADRALSLKELLRLSPNQANRQYQRDLLSILLPMQKYPEGVRQFLGGAYTFTKAVTTEYQPLCQHEMVVLHYRPEDPGNASGDSLYSPTSVSTERTYRFVEMPKLEHVKTVEQGDRPYRASGRSCRSADTPYRPGDLSEWFRASSPADAMYAGFAMLALQEWAKKTGNNFTNCATESNNVDCNQEAAAQLGLHRIGHFSLCQARAKNEVCVELGDYGSVFTVRARATGELMRADDILSVSFESQIIVT